MSLQPVTFTIDGKPVEVDGWQFNDTEGGYDQCSGVITSTDYLRLGSPSQGEAVKAHEGDEVRWAGRFAAPPQIKEGRAYFNALGYKEALAKKTQRLLFQSADLSQWVQYDSDPHLNGSDVPVYPRSRKIDLDATNSGLRFSVVRNQTLATGDEACFVFYAEGADLGGGRLRYTGSWNAADDFAKLEFRVQKADGPTGAESAVGAVGMGAGNRDTAQVVTIGGAASNDLITLGLRCNDGTFTPNSDHMRWMATRVRVNSVITALDSYDASDAVTYVVDEMGWDTDAITLTTFDVLPLDWIDGDWLEMCLYVAELEDKFFRVGDEAAEYDAWGTVNWNVTGAGADPDLKPLELFNQARVTFETATGVSRKSVRTTTDVSLTDPLAASGITNTVEYTLEDRQKNNTLAQNVADKLVRRFAVQRYAGSVEVVAARADDGRTDPRAIRYGDTITIQDWANNESQTLRVMEVAQGPDAVTVGVEQPVNIAALVAHTSAGKRRRGGHGKRGGGKPGSPGGGH